MKIAVLLSGELRSYKKCYPNFKKYFLSDKNVDVFIAVWKQVGKNTAGKNSNVRFHDRIVDEHNNAVPDTLKSIKLEPEHIVTEEEMMEMYKPKGLYFEDYKESYRDELDGLKRPDEMINGISTKQPGRKLNLGALSRTNLPMFYMMKKVIELKKDYEKENNFKYDIVLRIRPDLDPFPINWERYYNEFVKNDILVSFPSCRPVNLSDKFAFGNSKMMDYYMSSWDYLPEYWYPSEFEKPKQLYENLRTKKILDVKYRHCERLLYYRFLNDNMKFKEVHDYREFEK